MIREIRPSLVMAALVVTFTAQQPSRAEPAAEPAVAPVEATKDTALSTPDEIKLTPEETAERESRKSCKVAVCAALRNKSAGDDISCDITKSFRKTQLDKLVGKAKVSWPWGRVVCKSNLKLKRETLIKGMTEAKADTAFDLQQAKCSVERDKDVPADITFEFTPKVVFENGKAVKASMNWGKVDGPKLIKGMMWTATATDNTLNVLGSTIVEDFNVFATSTCDELKDGWVGK
jgi:hypothetical protein